MCAMCPAILAAFFVNGSNVDADTLTTSLLDVAAVQTTEQLRARRCDGMTCATKLYYQTLHDATTRVIIVRNQYRATPPRLTTSGLMGAEQRSLDAAALDATCVPAMHLRLQQQPE